MKLPTRNPVRVYLWITAAAFLYALGFNWCYVPNQIAFGGITGTAQIIHQLIPALPIGTLAILFNIPLFLLGWKYLGGRVLVSSLYAMAASSVFIDLIAARYTFAPMEPMLACIYGGLLLGFSLGLVFLQGATTGGTDLLARLLKLRLTWLPMGRLLLFVDLVIILAAALVFGSLHSALYGLVALYLSSKVLDTVLYGLDNAKVAYIISDKHQEISDVIVRDLDRGVTILHGKGAWSGQDKQILLCAFKQRQIVPLKRVVQEIDPAAFVIVCEAHEILGEGFRSHHQSEM